MRRPGGASRKQTEAQKKRLRELTVKVEPPLFYDVTSNTIYYLSDDEADWRLTGSLGGGAYTAQEIVAVPGGGWADFVRTATLHEINGLPTVGVVRVSARRRRNGLWTFSAPC
jgi:hypothetical protein